MSLILLSVFSFPSWAEEEKILDRIEQTGVLKVGVREDAVPFGYRDLNDDLRGLCLDFFEFLRQELKLKLDREIISIDLYKSRVSNRFELVKDKITYLECGPNTINRDLDTVDFSSPFFITGTQLLMRREQKQRVNPDSNLEGKIIGVLHNTSNQRFILGRYPSATIQEFRGVTGRKRGVQALQEGIIDAFASDGILLIGEAVLLGLSLGQDYLILPNHPLECDYYGLILPKNDPDWRDFVNSTLKAARSARLFREWFGILLPEIEETLKYCRANRGKGK